MSAKGGSLHFTGISGMYWYRCLPVSACDHLFCHLISQDFLAAVLMSSSVAGVVSCRASASVAASLASLSATSLPAMFAWPGVQLTSTSRFEDCRSAISCLVSRTVFL